MYHRIADDPVDHWHLAVSPARFAEQLEVLRRTRVPFSLTDFARRLIDGTLPPNAVALTFDDGYVDNLVAAKPCLAAADVPATLFLTTGFVDRVGSFWWDELARLILLEDGPGTFELVVRGESMRFDIGGEPPVGESGAGGFTQLTLRRAAIMRIWQAIRLLDDQAREPIMARLRSIFAGQKYRPWPGRTMTGEEVRALIADRLVMVGAHTVTHPVLAGLEPGACHREITESKRMCEALTGAPVQAFAYPYGDFDDNARETVRAAGFSFACSARGGPAFGTSDIFALPRINISNLDGDAFERTLRFASVTS